MQEVWTTIWWYIMFVGAFVWQTSNLTYQSNHVPPITQYPHSATLYSPVITLRVQYGCKYKFNTTLYSLQNHQLVLLPIHTNIGGQYIFHVGWTKNKQISYGGRNWNWREYHSGYIFTLAVILFFWISISCLSTKYWICTQIESKIARKVFLSPTLQLFTRLISDAETYGLIWIVSSSIPCSGLSSTPLKFTL